MELAPVTSRSRIAGRGRGANGRGRGSRGGRGSVRGRGRGRSFARGGRGNGSGEFESDSEADAEADDAHPAAAPALKILVDAILSWRWPLSEQEKQLERCGARISACRTAFRYAKHANQRLHVLQGDSSHVHHVGMTAGIVFTCCRTLVSSHSVE